MAVQRVLAGRPPAEWLAWLADRGTVSRIPMHIPGAPPTYRFVSAIGMECVFFLDGFEFVFVGDHTTYTAEPG